MTRFMFRYVENNYKEGIQPYFLYDSGKVPSGSIQIKKKHLPRFQA
jgi:hypothetical protein